MQWNKITNIMIILGLVIFCYPLISYTGEEKAPKDALQVLTEPDAAKREQIERERVQQAIEDAKKDGDILKADQKRKEEIYLNGKKTENWPEN